MRSAYAVDFFYILAASGDVQTYQIRTAPTSTIAPGVVMASSPAIPAQPAEEAARKREVRLMKNRYNSSLCVLGFMFSKVVKTLKIVFITSSSLTFNIPEFDHKLLQLGTLLMIVNTYLFILEHLLETVNGIFPLN